MIIGHKKTIADLKLLADSGNLAHGYLFHGPSMVGKRTVAEGLANYLENRIFNKPTVLIDETGFTSRGERSIGIDTVREIKNFLWQKPAKSPRRVAIIGEAELLTTEAQNALLKIAEEPPPSSLIIFVAQSSEAIFETLRSRLHGIYFSTVESEEITDWLEREFGLKKSDAENLARSSLGKPGLAFCLAKDKNFAEALKTAGKFFSLKEAERRDFIKNLIEPKDFNPNTFIDSLILYLTLKSSARNPILWHKLLKLRSRNEDFALNPRLQLENLLL